ncbi:MAG TPA: sigma-70 family RNA polymerase sigma factor [Puia sp.]|jgi:RNA polymerase sigma-70 factor (ECF subfamily)
MKVSNEGEDWFPLFRGGDKNAFRQVFETHYRSILYFASNVLQQDSFAEDIVSDTFRKAWDNRERFDTPRHLENFLFFVTRNACISHLRSGRTAHGVEQRWAEMAEGNQEANGDIDLEKVKTQLLELLYKHLSTLNGGEVLRMAYLEGKSTREIAAEMKISENNVYIIKSRTLQQLRELLGKDALSLLFLLFFRDLL